MNFMECEMNTKKKLIDVMKDINKKAEEYNMIQEYMTSKEFLDIQKRLEKILPSVFEAINYYEDA